jgi:4-hydroxy-tetrahydrodipicolinate reductase
VAGLKSVAHGIKDGKPVIVLEFISHASVEEEYDAVSIEGVPEIHEKIAGGVHGDIGTVAMIINIIPKVLNARPGLVTMKELPLPSAATEDMRIYLKWKNNPKSSQSNLNSLFSYKSFKNPY